MAINREWRTIIFLGFIIVYTIFLVAHLEIVKLGPGKVFPDTIGYVEVANESLLSAAFLGGVRPFSLPLLYKISGINIANFRTPEAIEQISRIQAIISWASFGLLAGVFAGIQGIQVRSFVPLILLQLFGLCLHISQWNNLLLSESLSTSLFVALAALLIAGISYLEGKRRSNRNEVLGKFLLIAVILDATLYSYTRDINSYFILLLGIVGLPLLLHGKTRKKIGVPFGLVSGFFILIFITQQISINAGGRWKGPFIGSLRDRILSVKESRSYFIENGMPYGDWADADLLKMPRGVFLENLSEDTRAQDFLNWIQRDGRQVYFMYALSHPRFLVSGPIRAYGHLINSNSIEYQNQAVRSPRLLEWLTKLMYPTGNLGLLALIGTTAIFVRLAIWQLEFKVWWVVPIVFLVLIPAQMLLVWHADSFEVERHAYQITLNLRLALWIMIGTGCLYLASQEA